MTSRYIAIDWGSTNLRAWLYQGDECLESRQSEAGVTRLNGKSPAAVFSDITENWRDGATPVVMAGMVGSNVGWKTALSAGSRHFSGHWSAVNGRWRQYLDYSRPVRLATITIT
jgi:hypothetical protein